MIFLVGGVDVSAQYKNRSLRITEKTGADRAGFKFRLENPDEAPSEKIEVLVYANDAALALDDRLAAGRVRRAKRDPVAVDTSGAPVFAFEVEVGLVQVFDQDQFGAIVDVNGRRDSLGPLFEVVKIRLRHRRHPRPLPLARAWRQPRKRFRALP